MESERRSPRERPRNGGYSAGMTDYQEVNRANWDERVPAHVASPDYGVSRFIDDPGFLSEVVRFDIPLLGDITGLRGVHLQCHIGTDTVSLARLGASMTGLDFSEPAVAAACALASATGADATFVQAELYAAVDVLGHGGFDLVYTGTGALCWLPSIRRWAGVVIITALLAEGMALTGFTEHDSVPWEALPGKMARTLNGEWRLVQDPSRLPCSYTLQAVKR